jgi:hypothetical protein
MVIVISRFKTALSKYFSYFFTTDTIALHNFQGPLLGPLSEVFAVRLIGVAVFT